MKRNALLCLAALALVGAVEGGPRAKPALPPVEGQECLGPFERVPERAAGHLPVAGWTGPRERLLPLRFSQKGSHKVICDFPLRCDLAKSGSLTLDLFVSSRLLSVVPFYLRSGAGWYATTLKLPNAADGWTRLTLTRESFPRTEDSPVGWNRIDGMRLSFLRPGANPDLQAMAAVANVCVPDGTPETAARMKAGKAARKAVCERFAREADAWAAEQRGKPGERRLMWCHSPMGLNKDGDWETSVRELKACGYTDLIANFAWGLAADYRTKCGIETALVAKEGDLLARAQAACRKHGVKLHVWLVCWPMRHSLGKGVLDSLDCAGRLQYDENGRRVAMNGSAWLCPGAPENRAALHDMMLELAARGVDGVHFDYIRYPGESACYCQPCRKRFEAEVGHACADWPKCVRAGGRDRAAWVAFRQRNVTALVKAVADDVHANYPRVEVSAAVFRNPGTDAVSYGQDWPLWVREKYLDFVCPMDYTWCLPEFRSLLLDQKKAVGTVGVYPGIGLTSSARFPADGGDALRFTEQVQAVREAGFDGFTCFNFDGRCLRAMKVARSGVLRKEGK